MQNIKIEMYKFTDLGMTLRIITQSEAGKHGLRLFPQALDQSQLKINHLILAPPEELFTLLSLQ